MRHVGFSRKYPPPQRHTLENAESDSLGQFLHVPDTSQNNSMLVPLLRMKKKASVYGVMFVHCRRIPFLALLKGNLGSFLLFSSRIGS